MDKSNQKSLLINFMRQFTNIDEIQLEKIANDIPIVDIEKGTILLEQGEIPEHCIFIIKGCIRQYRINENGNELTSDFYTENQWITIFYERDDKNASKFSLSCVEDCVLVMGDVNAKEDMFNQYMDLKEMTYRMLEDKIGEIKEDFSDFMASSPEERVKALMQNRPDLFKRVPQHQLASFLGMTPESLSRIKRRLEIGKK